jgi:hypothetical protein
VLVHDTPEQDPDNAPFRWIRAPEAEMIRRRRFRTMGACVLAAAATLVASAQFGRFSGHQTAAHREPQALIRTSSVAPRPMTAPIEAAVKPTTARETPDDFEIPREPASSAAQPMPSPEQADRHASIPRAASITVELRPLAADDQGQDSRPPPAAPSQVPTEKYEALRDFVMGSRWYALEVARNPRGTY